MRPIDIDGPGHDKGLRLVDSISSNEFPKSSIMLGAKNPKEALAAQYIGLYATSPYRSEAVPVVFIHGINDSPRCFARLTERLSVSALQHWHFWYPTGMSLSSASEYLAETILQLSGQYAFSRLLMVAHSMGGLIGRRAIQLIAGHPRAKVHVSRFLTFSTPWGGHDAARMGMLLHYPRMLDSWVDIASKGPFITSLFQDSLPGETSFHLYFSYRRTPRLPFLISGLPHAGNHDGFVSLDSQLYPPAQSEAAEVRGFATSHRGILRNAASLDKCAKIVLQEVEGP